MYHFPRPKALLAAVVLASLLSGCDDNDSSTPIEVAPDTIPDSFTIPPLTDAEIGSTLESQPVIISGLDAAAKISISGGEYSIDGGEFTSADGEIENGQSLVLRANDVQPGQTLVVTVDVGGVQSEFTVTVAHDTTPDEFSFTAVDDVPAGWQVDSTDYVTVAGITTAVEISVSGGQYRIGEGEFTADAGEVSAGDEVVLRVQAASTPETASTATLTIGGVSADFVVTTQADTAEPTGAILFPTPSSFTTATTLTVRGTASDDFGIAKVELVTYVNEEEFSRVEISEGNLTDWQAEIALAPDVGNEVHLIVTDLAGKTFEYDDASTFEDKNAVFVAQVEDMDAFPTMGPFFAYYPQRSFSWDQEGRVLINTAVPEFGYDSIALIDIYQSGSGPFGSNNTSGFFHSDVIKETEAGRFLLGLSSAVLAVDLESEELSIGSVDLASPTGLAYVPSTGQTYVLDSEGSSLIRINSEGVQDLTRQLSVSHAEDIMFGVGPYPVLMYVDGEGVIHLGSLDVSSGGVTDSVTVLEPDTLGKISALEMDYDAVNHRFIFDDVDPQDGNNSIYAATLSPAGVSKIVDGASAAEGMDLPLAFHIEVDDENQRALVFGPEDLTSEFERNSLYAVDLVTGERVIVYSAMNAPMMIPPPGGAKMADGKTGGF